MNKDRFSFLGGVFISVGLLGEIEGHSESEILRVVIKPPHEVVMIFGGKKKRRINIREEEEIVILPVPEWAYGFGLQNPWDSAVLKGGYCLRGEIQEIVNNFLKEMKEI